MKTLTTPMQAAVSARITRPLHFVQIDASPVLRFCTLSDTSWAGYTWSRRDMQISGLGGSGSPQIVFADPDGVIAAAALSGLLDDKPITLWAGDATATAAGDPVQSFTGAIDSFAIDPAAGRTTITLAAAPPATLFAPRLFYGPGMGMNTMIPAGTILKVGDKVYTVERL
jgi:hypothetical protein